jgi:hypothetical protein
LLVALLAMCKRVAAHIVEGIAVGQLRLAQDPELGRRRMQFQLGGQHLLHRPKVACFTESVKCGICEQFHPTHTPNKDSPFLPRRERRGLLARWVELTNISEGLISVCANAQRNIKGLIFLCMYVIVALMQLL